MATDKDTIRAVLRYVRHDDACSQSQSGCICGLREVLRGIVAILAGRATNHPERPESSTGRTGKWGPSTGSGDDDGN